jgi:hypothetical protein
MKASTCRVLIILCVTIFVETNGRHHHHQTAKDKVANILTKVPEKGNTFPYNVSVVILYNFRAKRFREILLTSRVRIDQGQRDGEISFGNTINLSFDLFYKFLQF